MQAGADLDAALIDASRSGDRTAFAQIIERYHRAVYAVSFASVRDRALADDITQDTFVTAWRRLGDLRDNSRLPAWLCGIARNLGRDARKRLRRETVSDDGAREPIDATTPYEALSEAQSERLVAVALGQIPDVYREPLVLYYYEERSVDDVARSLGISTATTNKRLSRGRQYLAERVATIVEGAVTRRGPSPALAASVLAVIGIGVPASHVDASPAPVKGSNMHKLAIAAVVTATLGGGGLIVAATSRSGDAHAGARTPTGAKTPSTETAQKSTTGAAPGTGLCAEGLRAFTAPRAPALASDGSATATHAATDATMASDCAAVGRHLSELEADTTHGPSHRPDEATCDACANNYKSRCESEGWSLERRICTLAAGDLINAHLCAGGSAPVGTTPTTIPASLSCATLGNHIATTVQAAGIYADVADMGTQITSACELGAWPIELRQCFAAASTVATLEACVKPPAP